MLEHDRIAVSEGIYVNNTSSLCKCIVCHYILVLTWDKF